MPANHTTITVLLFFISHVYRVSHVWLIYVYTQEPEMTRGVRSSH